MIDAIGQGVTNAIGYVGQVVTALIGETGDLNELLPIVGLAIGLGLVGFGISKVKSLVWGM